MSVDLVLSIAAAACFLRGKPRQQYPWLSRYLCVRSGTALAVAFLLYGPLLASPAAYTRIYFVVHWASYVVSAVLLFLSCLDVYREAMTPLPGLVRMGTTVFRWAAVASLLVTATTLTSVSLGPGTVIQVAVQMMRCVGTAELCLLAFLVLSMKAIGLSPRARPFGMALGLGGMAIIDCVASSVAALAGAISPVEHFAFELGTVGTLAVWIAYAALPEPARKPVTVAVNSAIYKWDQIASALGHKGTKVVVQPTPSFFLVDVEKVVDRAFVRNLKSKESES